MTSINIDKIISTKKGNYTRFISKDEVSNLEAADSCRVCSSSSTRKIIEIGGSDWEKTLDLSQCLDCGHIYYSQLFSEETILNYYENEWAVDQKTMRPTLSLPKSKALNIISDLNYGDLDLKFIDIGCGSGGSLHALQQAGYKNLFGCEQSLYRVQNSRLIPDVEIFNAGYQGVQDDLVFDVIYSNHVLEHIYDPRDFFNWADKHLTEDGIVILCVPNAAYEGILGQSLFLPHLHSFTPESLKTLGEQFGYQCVNWKGTGISGKSSAYDMAFVFYKTEKKLTIEGKFQSVSSMTHFTKQQLFERIQNCWLSAKEGRSCYIFYTPSMEQQHQLLWQSYVRLSGLKVCGFYFIKFIRKLLTLIKQDRRLYGIISKLHKLFGIPIGELIIFRKASQQEAVPRIHCQNLGVLLFK